MRELVPIIGVLVGLLYGVTGIWLPFAAYMATCFAFIAYYGWKIHRMHFGREAVVGEPLFGTDLWNRFSAEQKAGFLRLYNRYGEVFFKMDDDGNITRIWK